jgi:hypothetical protein
VDPVSAQIDLEANALEQVLLEHEPLTQPLPVPAIDENSPRGKGNRLLPRWAEIVGLVFGGGVAASGAVLVALEGTCPGGADPNDVDACPKVRRTLPGGIATLAIGGAFAVTSAILLAVDETRVRKRKQPLPKVNVRLGPGWIQF